MNYDNCNSSSTYELIEKNEQKIKEDIHENAWNSDINAFVQSYGSRHLDASVLLMEPYGFIHARDPKYVSTVKAIEEGLSNDGLLYRYKNEDDFGLPSSSFTICTFWFINALFKIGEEEKSQKLMLKVFPGKYGTLKMQIVLQEGFALIINTKDVNRNLEW